LNLRRQPRSHETFLERWSRRKREQNADQAHGPPAPAPTVRTPAAPSRDEFADLDFGALDFTSNFARFMRDGVPDDVRNRALQQLWRSTDVISRPDDLDDYLEDFSETAMALPPELAKSAYRIGQGFVSEDKAPPSNSDAAPDTAGPPQSGLVVSSAASGSPRRAAGGEGTRPPAQTSQGAAAQDQAPNPRRPSDKS
jgi:hypothetical protein